ncbi:MAG: triose-phosphate isomerase [Gemmatimonadaceae bacterium]|jgi:triosephosphate isomerase
MKSLVFAANWKMNQAPADAALFMRTFLGQYTRQNDRRVLFFPPAVSLHPVVEAIHDRADLQAGVQNIHWEDSGAFTGEISAGLARGAGARYVLVGHSERRLLFGETEGDTAKKVAAAVRAGLTPVICVGETLQQREAEETLTVIRRQLRAALEGQDAAVVASILVAYEPVWAIGTGRTATPQDAAEAHAALKGELRALGGGERSGAIPVLYGGSVNRANVEALLAVDEVDGVLVGGASLDAEQWLAIVRS